MMLAASNPKDVCFGFLTLNREHLLKLRVNATRANIVTLAINWGLVAFVVVFILQCYRIVKKVFYKTLELYVFMC